MKSLLLRAITPLATAIPAISGVTACSAAERLPVRSELTAPLSELSGLAVRTRPSGETELLAVGDEARELVVMPIGPDGPDASRARRIALPMPERSGGSELEGVAVDVDGLVYVIAERGEVFAFRLIGDTAVEVSRQAISAPAGHPLAAAWEGDSNARAEGLALVGGRIFIVKQKDPVALIELKKEGEGLALHTHWRLSDLDDASELALSGDRFYVLGARSAKVCAFAVPAAESGDTGAALSCLASWALPDKLGKGEPRWEGLVVLPGETLVGVDRKKTDSPNLARLPPIR